MQKLHDTCYLLARKHHYNVDRAMADLARGQRLHGVIEDDFISILDERYPTDCLHLTKPPLALCYEGDFSLTKRFKVGLIGSRMCSSYGCRMVALLMRHLDCSVVIVSGMATGIDGEAHRQALASGKKSIGIIGGGLDTVYPAQHAALYADMRKEHLLLSEYARYTPIKKHHFPRRNALLAALSDVLVVIESKVNSGTSTTVQEMLLLGKEIYCIPHRLEDANGAGNHLLIQEGANIIYNIREFCQMMNEKNKLTNTE